jgi:uncharacterized sulfatase
VLGVLVLSISTGCGRERDGANRPQPAGTPGELNVLMIVIDDLRPDLGAYGRPGVHSPNIDRLAERALRFDHAYCQFPVCNPSRSSFLTGLRPPTTGVLDNEVHFRDLLPDVVTLPELFRMNGYHTASIGKIFHGAGGQKGWANPESWDEALFPRGRRHGRATDGENRIRFESGDSIGWIAASGDDTDQTDGMVARETIEILDRVRDRPFFVAAGFLRPHTPMVAPKRYFDLYSLEELKPYLPVTVDSSVESTPALGKAKLGEIDEQGQLEILRAYYACISFVDAQVGEILDTLDRLDLWSNTAVVLLSDHGIHLGERDWWSKNTLSEVSARVPLIVYVPEMRTAGEASSAVVELIDLYPTLADLAGLPEPPGLEGRSLRPLLDDPAATWEGTAITLAARGDSIGVSVRTDRWRLIDWGDQLELYDHLNDPDELVNVAGSLDYAETLEKLLRTGDTIRNTSRKQRLEAD